MIGTNITIFPSMASVFPQEFFGQFLREGVSIGAAVRSARLKLLDYGDPLGLVYIPFVYAGLKLEKEWGTEKEG